jgi:hypothetical protein
LKHFVRIVVRSRSFFVVPGNHDVLKLGNIWHPTGPLWFKRIMFSQTGDAVNRLQNSLGFGLGLNEKTLKWSWAWLKRFNPCNSLWLNIDKRKCDGRQQSCDWRKGGMKWPSQSIYQKISIACFESNPSSLRAFAFANGEVEAAQVNRLGSVPRSI